MGSRIRRGTGLAVLASLVGTMWSAAPANAAPASPVASAYVVAADAIGAIVAVPPTPVSNFPPGGTVRQLGINAGPFASSSTLTATTAGNVPNGTSSASATVQNLAVNLGALVGSLDLTGINATCNATPAGATGSATITSGTATPTGLLPVTLPAQAAPNTAIGVPGLGTITLNEQTTDVDGVLTVNAVHLLLLPEFGAANVIIGHAECGGSAPAPSIVKSAAEGTFIPGQTVHYSYTVTDRGTDPLTDVTVTDSGPGTPLVTCPDTTLAAGASEVCTATYTATTEDGTARRIVDRATVTGSLPDASTVTGTSNRVTIPLAGTGVGQQPPGQQPPGHKHHRGHRGHRGHRDHHRHPRPHRHRHPRRGDR